MFSMRVNPVSQGLIVTALISVVFCGAFLLPHTKDYLEVQTFKKYFRRFIYVQSICLTFSGISSVVWAAAIRGDGSLATAAPVPKTPDVATYLLKMDVPAEALNVEVWLDNKRIAARVTNDNLLAVAVPAKEGPTHFELKGSRYDTKPFDIIVNQNGEIFPYTGDLRIYPE
jgi:hypothetical protein